MDDGTTIERLKDVLSPDTALDLAVLFGSAASGRMHAASDVDVAILGGDAANDGALEMTVGAATAGMPVHLVRLETASTLLRWQVATRGTPLLERRPGEFARFRARAASEYLDYAPALAHYSERFRRRLIEEGTPR